MSDNAKTIVLEDMQCIYTPDAGTYGEDIKVFCGVCGRETTVERDLDGPRSFAGAMKLAATGIRSTVLHDLYCCPDREEDWHKQVVLLRQEMDKTPSKKMEYILQAEVKDVLEYRAATKEV